MSGLPLHKVENLQSEDMIIHEHEHVKEELKIHDDLAVSESDEEGGNTSVPMSTQQIQDDDDAGDGDLWF